jgi:DNA-binding Lrp family transcriptional regulator|tara:strand:- start:193 stop:420 length:228 start_codon:yes stop_codon:yes gene_type:complete
VPSAIMLINLEKGYKKELVNDIKSIENVTEVHELYGIYDAVVKIESDSFPNLKESSFEKIRGLKSIRSTLTMTIE